MISPLLAAKPRRIREWKMQSRCQKLRLRRTAHKWLSDWELRQFVEDLETLLVAETCRSVGIPSIWLDEAMAVHIRISKPDAIRKWTMQEITALQNDGLAAQNLNNPSSLLKGTTPGNAAVES